MGKIIEEEEIRIVIKLARQGGTAPVEVSVRAEYTVKSEDLLVARILPSVDITSTQERQIKQFGAAVLQQIKDAEGIS